MIVKLVRRIVATISFVAITLLFLDFTGTVHLWFGWLAKMQFIPAVLSGSMVITIGLVLLTLLCGRIYCSVLCPLGVMQDLISNLSAKRKGKKARFSFSQAKNKLRIGIFILFAAAILIGILSEIYTQLLVEILSPYSSYGRIAHNLFLPLWQLGNNMLAYLTERLGYYSMYPSDIWIKNGGIVVVSAITLVVISILAWKNGRTYCNTICPVGTILGFLSKFSLLKIRIDPNKCVECSLCARNCKSSCIDYKNYRVDASRCIACMNCIGKCKKGAIHYGLNLKCAAQQSNAKDVQGKNPIRKSDTGRRDFVVSSLLLTCVASMKSFSAPALPRMAGALNYHSDSSTPKKKNRITPPGSKGYDNMRSHCTACQLCVSACPNKVLRPSTSPSSFMQPEMAFDRSYCLSGCTRCSDVCPVGAIRKLSVKEKARTQVGHAVWISQNCITQTSKQPCGMCAHHCPNDAIEMCLSNPLDESSIKIPVVHAEKCIGCGACENQCPAKPLKAIYVEGNVKHKTI